MSCTNCQQQGHNSATCKNNAVARECIICGPDEGAYDEAFDAGYEAARDDARMLAAKGELSGWLDGAKTEAA